MEKKVPTTIITIGKTKDKQEVEIYQWLTQDEEDQLAIMQIGSEKVVMGDKTEEADKKEEKFTVPYEILINARNFRLKALIKNPTWEEITTWRPELRAEVMNKVDEVVDKKKS